MALTDGMSTADMQSQLAALQKAYFELSSGAKVVSASYSQGDGSKSVSYQQSDLAQMMRSIQMLQKSLGIIPHYHRARRILF